MHLAPETPSYERIHKGTSDNGGKHSAMAFMMGKYMPDVRSANFHPYFSHAALARSCGTRCLMIRKDESGIGQ